MKTMLSFVNHLGRIFIKVSIVFLLALNWTNTFCQNIYPSSGNAKINNLFLGRYGTSLSGDSNPYNIHSDDGEAHDLTVFGGSASTLHLRLYDGDLKMGNEATPNTTLYNNGNAKFGGNVGIGTSTPYSHSRLHAKALGVTPWSLMVEANTNDKVIGISHNGNSGVIATSFLGTGGHSPIQFVTTDISRLTIDVAGNVGIGTTTPEGKFTISQAGNGWYDGLRINRDASNYLTLTEDVTDVRLKNWGSGGIKFFTSSVEAVMIGNNGNVGIGTSSPDQKLTVNGTIHSKEVKVDLSVPAPDYVFEKEYKLPSLEEIKTYIDHNKHLPEVPSAKEMEANGVQLGEMNMLLLKKMEEMTLYMIDVKKEIEELKAENKKIKELLLK